MAALFPIGMDDSFTTPPQDDNRHLTPQESGFMQVLKVMIVATASIAAIGAFYALSSPSSLIVSGVITGATIVFLWYFWQSDDFQDQTPSLGVDLPPIPRR